MEHLTNLQYKDLLRKQIREYEYIINLGVSEKAKEEFSEEIKRIRQTLNEQQ